MTVFRDQEFTSDTFSRAVKRIEDVRFLRTFQFAEDAGPMAHPVRPDSYMEINNFYTTTVYEKGAEVVRMIHTLLGAVGFRRGMDLYFQRHDGQAVTCDDFVAAMEDANGSDLRLFRRWYSQAGTPRVAVAGEYDASSRAYTLTLTQLCPPTPGQTDKLPFHIPFAVGLLAPDGASMPLQLDGEEAPGSDTRVLPLTEPTQQFRFINLPAAPIPSLLRDFSAPVMVDFPCSATDLAFLLAHDSDPFNRWEAAQRLALQTILELVACTRVERPLHLECGFVEAVRALLTNTQLDPALVALALTLPDES